jgi:hypothetical protein
MTLLASLDPDRYRENRLLLPLWQSRIGVIYQGCYYLLPVCHTDVLGQPVLFETRALDSHTQVLQPSSKGDLYDRSGSLLQADRTGRVYEVANGQTRGYLHPILFQSIRRHIATIFHEHQLSGEADLSMARLDDQLIAIRRIDQERARKSLSIPAHQEAALKCAPSSHWDSSAQDSSAPWFISDKAKRGIGTTL